jgi:hypothetical protein
MDAGPPSGPSSGHPQAAADPVCRTITGDGTIDAAGVTAIGATKIRNVMLAAMAANTTNNAIAGSAVPTDCTASSMRTNNGTLRPCLPQRA